jgi:hypothetical protein
MTCENTRKAIAQGCKVTSQGWATDIASAIECSPKELLNAMAADGVLRSWDDGSGRRLYTVAPPHVHAWRVCTRGLPSGEDLVLQCATCREEQTVPNRIPIEVPK